MLVGIVLAVAALGADGAQGHLMIIGGGTKNPGVLARFVELAGGAHARVVVYPMASQEADTGPWYADEIRAAGAGAVAVSMLDRAQADADAGLLPLEGATGVFFTGGDQSRLTAALLGTRVHARIRELYRSGGVVGGTSAGAAVMSRVMITGDERRADPDQPFRSIEADDVVTSEGLGLLEEDVVIDQHFVRRRRQNRLLSLVLQDPRAIGVGIDEETALLVEPDRTAEVLGAGPVVVLDARGARTRVDPTDHGLRAAGVALHVLRHGDRYDFKTGEVAP